MAKSSTFIKPFRSTSRKRPGVHSKTKNSVHKSGKHYNKKYRGQGR